MQRSIHTKKHLVYSDGRTLMYDYNCNACNNKLNNMAIKYFCDTCGEEIKQSKLTAAKPICTVETVEPATQQRSSHVCCEICTAKLKEFLNTLKK